MAEDGFPMTHLPSQSVTVLPGPFETSIKSYDEQRLAHFGKRQQFRVSTFSDPTQAPTLDTSAHRDFFSETSVYSPSSDLAVHSVCTTQGCIAFAKVLWQWQHGKGH